MSSNNTRIRVAIRPRPLLSSDYPRLHNKEQRLATAVHAVKDKDAVVITDPLTTKQTHQFFFDKVFMPEDTNEEVYDIVARHIVQHAVRGYNGTIFAYGQTSTGKTHTIFGHSDASVGLVPMAISDVFDQIEAASSDRIFFVRIAVMELYNERISDLAVASNGTKPKSLRLRQAKTGFIFVENLVEEVCTSREGAHGFLSDCLTRRHMAQTQANQDSSRSHVICRIVVESRPFTSSDRQSAGGTDEVFDSEHAPTLIGEMNFVDLAGSECATNLVISSQPNLRGSIGGDQLPPETVLRLKEGRAINRSLLMLGIVISQLSESKPLVQYRNSKLTRILQNALGGNSLTAIVCTISPTEADKRQTISTLQFATNAKSIKNKPCLNETYSTDQAVLRRLQLEIERLRRRIAELEMRQTFSQVSSSSSERQHLHDHERLLIEMFANGRSASRTPLDSIRNSLKAPILSRRMTWAPTASGHALLMFADDKDRPVSSTVQDAEQKVEQKPITFPGILDKAASRDEGSFSQGSSLTPLKSAELTKPEAVAETIERIENESEFQERFVGRQYFDVVAKNYEKLRCVLGQSLGIAVDAEDDFSDVSDKISLLIAQSRTNSNINSASSSVRGETPHHFANGDSLKRTLSSGSDKPDDVPLVRNVRRANVMSARLPPLVIQPTLVRAKSSAGSFQLNNEDINGQTDLRPLSRASTTVMGVDAKRPALIQETQEDNGHGPMEETDSRSPMQASSPDEGHGD